MRLLYRLAGLETEYVARFRPDEADAKRPLTLHLLVRLIEVLKRRLPLVPADYPKKGFFLATGGAVWQERPGDGLDYPLIEGSTPECRGPLQLLAYQRAQDRLLAAAARDVEGGDFTLCKSDSDVEGRVYGSQENYDAVFARGWRLMAWCAAVVFVVSPLIILGWAGVSAVATVLTVYYLVAIVVYVAVALCIVPMVWLNRTLWNTRVREFLLGPWGGEPFRLMPMPLSIFARLGQQIVLAPAHLVLGAFASWLAFREVRWALLPFLISRAIVGGSGRLCEDGNFQIASKAHGLKLVSGTAVFRIRPIFNFSPQFKASIFFSFIASRKFPSLMASRQRLHISMGDGNLCEEAEYLRIGTTMLVLDAIEAGYPIDVPVLRNPLRALRTVIADPKPTARVTTIDGNQITAIEIQKIYLKACQQFVAAQTDAPPEAHDVLERWEKMLNDLEREPECLVGRVDWITKKWLMEAAGKDASWESLKKIDLRYHELSPNGYFERLRSTGMVTAILTDAQIDSAGVTPPQGSPAAERGNYIRQLVSSGQTACANWQSVSVGIPSRARIVWQKTGE